MNLEYLINYAILSVFLSLFFVEVGIALISLFWWKKYRTKLKHYINPIWAVDGTFGVFYLVNLEATYPNLLPTAGIMYIAPVLFGALFLIFRNAFISYSEITDSKVTEHKYILTYALATLIIAFVAVSVLASSVSGIGTNINSETINLMQMFLSPFSLGLFIAAIMFSLFLVTAFFDIKELSKFLLLFPVIGILIVALISELYLPYLLANVLVYSPFLLVIILALVSTFLSGHRKGKDTKILAFITVFLGIFFFGLLQYPYMFGQAANIQAYLNNSAISQYILIITAVGSLFLMFSIYYFIKINYLSE